MLISFSDPILEGYSKKCYKKIHINIYNKKKIQNSFKNISIIQLQTLVQQFRVIKNFFKTIAQRLKQKMFESKKLLHRMGSNAL
ncbi:hypothetical protein HCUR_01283 [Holospora curviuscula]|uniref:Uncharacterized protein n=1 Tax=Holospora curviuscula TaxID=1082868 RepID=A0A2S5R7G1_9PROT|nr:hypothetical protein HCUR_01283 [Holospora curviuscula]